MDFTGDIFELAGRIANFFAEYGGEEEEGQREELHFGDWKRGARDGAVLVGRIPEGENGVYICCRRRENGCAIGNLCIECVPSPQ